MVIFESKFFYQKRRFGIFRLNVAEEIIHRAELITFFTIAKENLQRESRANKSNKSNAGTGNCHRR